jgi:hypothetical protein
MRFGMAVIGLAAGLLAAAAATSESYAGTELAAQSRPRITVHPRRVHPGPNARRYCRSWLAKEYRVSGPVVVPRMRCWWE